MFSAPGQVAGRGIVAVPSRCGPRHCDQSAPAPCATTLGATVLPQSQSSARQRAPNVLHVWSVLMASVGLILAARIAGSRLPVNVIPTDTLMAIAMAGASAGLTPTNKDSIQRPAR